MCKILTIVGIRPDFIRMSKIIERLDENFNHIVVHTGQHFDHLLSDVFFKELNIRKPDYNLCIGSIGKTHYHQTAELSVKLIELIKEKKINPKLIIFLGDSNSVSVAVQLKKEGYSIAHIEAGMRSGDKRMLEEINRTVCDHCSDYHFVYHENYRNNLLHEGFPRQKIFVVGNTIVEVCNQFVDEIKSVPKKEDKIILDIHRPENFKYRNRLRNIIHYANWCKKSWSRTIKMLNFKRTLDYVKDFTIPLGDIEVCDLMSYKDFLNEQYHALFTISDSGTAQEEPALLDTPVIVPRDFTERPESIENNCSFMIDVNNENDTWQKSINFLNGCYLIKIKPSLDWLGNGKTSEMIVKEIRSFL